MEKNKKQISNILTIFITLLLLTIIIISFSLSINTFHSNARKDKDLTITISIIKIKEGDSLWSIAQEYNNNNIDIKTYIDEIKRTNNIKNNKIYAGNYIAIPHYNKTLD